MKQVTAIILFLASLTPSYGQEEYFTYCQQVPSWKDFIIDSTLKTDKIDILIVTNRPFSPDQQKFLPNDIANWRKVSYMLAYCENDKWHIYPIKNLETGMRVLNTGEDVVLFVHGHGKNFPLALTRASQTQIRYDVKTILFDWPSYNRNFNKSMARVRHCGENFYNILLQLEDYKKAHFNSNQKLSIFAHSLGNYFISHMVVNGNNQFLNTKFIDNLIINASAIKAGDHAKVLSQIKFSERIYVTVNKNDRVLRGAHMITYGKMLGNFVTPPKASNTNYLHFTPLVGKQHTYFAGYHEFEYTNPVVFNFYHTALHGYEVNFNQEELYHARETEDEYDVVIEIYDNNLSEK